MVSGPRTEGAAAGIPSKDRKTVMSIKEVARDHSVLEIYAALKESNMDPDETAQKLLNQDPFHEVRKKKDKKKENTGNKISNEPRKPMAATAVWSNNQASSDWNNRRSLYTRSTHGISHEFRVVRDNRVNQIANGDAKPEMSCIPESSIDQTQTKPAEKRSDQKRSIGHSDGRSKAFGSNKFTASEFNLAKGGSSTDSRSELRSAAASKHTADPHKEVEHIPSTPTPSRSTFGVYSSSSDPVHVPTDSRAAGTVGTIKREVGVVGKRPTSQPAISGNSLPTTPIRGDSFTPTDSSEQPLIISKSTQFHQNTSEHLVLGNPGRNFPSNQHGYKQRPQSAGHQKASQSTMEWKPKSVKKPSTESGTNDQVLVPDITHSESISQAVVDSKLAAMDIHENEHVIIPKHLRVPEAERVHVTFGSFGLPDSSTDAAVAVDSSMDLKDSDNEPTSVAASSSPKGSNEDISVEDAADFDENQSRNYVSESPASTSHSAQKAIENVDSRTVENFGDILLVQSRGHSQDPSEQRNMQASPNMPIISETYEIQQNYDVPFLRETIEDNMHAQGLGSLPEVNPNVSSSSPPTSVPLLTHQQPLSQHQPPVTQLYPQLQFSHFPNYLPYHRQILSPMFVPPMALPTNYTTNPAYAHPSNGSSYLLMPGGNSHMTAGGMKFGGSQFKPAATGSPTAYGSYTSPAGYAISTPGSGGNTNGLDDIARIKYKDNNLYVQNPQAETSELWVQNPRDMAGMQSPHYYNVPGQAPHAAYLPTHAGHAASFNAAVQPSHLQFPGLYHPPQPAGMANPHHLVHQQVPPSIGGNPGVGMSAPGPQVGSYQQPQLGHLNWSSSF